MALQFLPVTRTVTFGTTLVFAAVLLGLNAHLTYFTEQYLDGYFPFAALSIASACLTLISLPIMIVVDRFRDGAVTSMVIFELVWLFILWVLWLASAAEATMANSYNFPGGCDYGFDIVDGICREFHAVVAFNYLTWFAFFAYTVVVLVITLIAKSRGASTVWTASVTEVWKNMHGGTRRDIAGNGVHEKVGSQGQPPVFNQPQGTGGNNVGVPEAIPVYSPAAQNGTIPAQQSASRQSPVSAV
ncbi:hypothetical protein V5O48_000828 [Marasmius crinis-equi]|uniref:MARVEL domain-containing protein n=1 Tax=Marasmius crinis-equi TaxID=585013 RepID=A0ABR3G0A4_9AGAR